MITLPSPSSRQSTLYTNAQHGCGCQILSAVWSTALSNFDRKWKTRIPANQDVTDCLPKLFEPLIVAVSVHEKKFLFAIFQKKRKIIFKKAECKKKKKNRIPPKSGRLTSLSVPCSHLLPTALFTNPPYVKMANFR